MTKYKYFKGGGGGIESSYITLAFKNIERVLHTHI